ncbi:MAG: GIY-YIG nuclease family protein [bacterium]
MVHVYILRSLRTGKLYVGHTKDLSRRLAEHNTGQGVTGPLLAHPAAKVNLRQGTGQFLENLV